MEEFAPHNSSPTSSHLPADLVLNTNAIHLNPEGIFVQIHLSLVRSERYSRLILDLSPDNCGSRSLRAGSSGKSSELAGGLGPLRYSIPPPIDPSILESGRRVVTTFHDFSRATREAQSSRVSSFLSQGNRIIPRIRYHGRCLGSFATVGERDDLHTFSTGGNEIAREAKMAKPLFPPYLKRTLAIRRRNKMYATYQPTSFTELSTAR